MPTYMQNELTNPLSNLPPELAGFGDYNAAIVAYRYARRQRNQVPIERWVEMAKWAAGDAFDQAILGASVTPDQPITLTAVLDRLGLTKKAAL
jgi:hypothetical protein